MIPITAAGGVVYRPKKEKYDVLLIFRNGVWDLPKGKKEEGESIEVCARREVAEETGIPLPEIVQFLTETYHEYKREGNDFGKTTHWFSMQTGAQPDFTPETEEGIGKVVWWPLAEAKEQVGYDNLKEVLQSFQNTLK